MLVRKMRPPLPKPRKVLQLERHIKSGGVVRMLRNLLILFIRAYQYCISPLFPPTCRFIPSCSSYAICAIRTHGPGKGIMLSVCRILRCNPWTTGGYDPVPPPANSLLHRNR